MGGGRLGGASVGGLASSSGGGGGGRSATVGATAEVAAAGISNGGGGGTESSATTGKVRGEGRGGGALDGAEFCWVAALPESGRKGLYGDVVCVAAEPTGSVAEETGLRRGLVFGLEVGDFVGVVVAEGGETVIELAAEVAGFVETWERPLPPKEASLRAAVKGWWGGLRFGEGGRDDAREDVFFSGVP